VQQQPPRYVVVEGPIGVGKTTLAKRLSQSFAADLILEQADENPFIKRFYQDPKTTALPTQLHFLLQRAKQIQALRQSDLFATCWVADFFLEKDRLFAELNLNRDELALYQQVYDNLALDAPVPDLVIYLQAPVDVLLTRIKQRAREYEHTISSDYLQRIARAYTEYFYYYNASPLLIVNAAEIDLARGEADYELLLKRIYQIQAGTHYFNPLPFQR